jgi:hypothetical protein
MAPSDADRTYYQGARARERALLELEFDALARGEGPTYAQPGSEPRTPEPLDPMQALSDLVGALSSYPFARRGRPQC